MKKMSNRLTIREGASCQPECCRADVEWGFCLRIRMEAPARSTRRTGLNGLSRDVLLHLLGFLPLTSIAALSRVRPQPV